MTYLAHVDFKTSTREKLSKEGKAMPDGSYPIRNRADLARAIQAYGRSKNKLATKRWIMRRARELDAVDLLPEDWKNMEQSMDFEDTLAHFGVKGMRWGVRKRRNESDRKKTFNKGKEEKKSFRDLSDEELRAVVNRMNLEQQYVRLSTSSSSRSGSRGNRAIAAGAAFVGGLALNIARQQLQNQANAQIGRALAARTAKKAAGS